MANIPQHPTSVSFGSRSEPPPGRRLLALTLVVMLVLGSVFPGFALAGESDSEGEGTAPPVEVPVDPGFDPGGEEEVLEESPATGDEETGTAEVEAEVEVQAPPPEEDPGAATVPPIEAAPPAYVPAPQSATSDPEPEHQQASEQPAEPVANEAIVAPKQKPARHSTATGSAASGEAAPPAEPVQPEAPPPTPQPAAVTSPGSGRSLTGKDVYVVRPGDCLWHIAADLLPGGADTRAIAEEVGRLWRLNEDRIGTGDPNLIYAGTELRLR